MTIIFYFIESIQSNDQKEYSKELFKETLEPRAPLLVKFLGGEAVKELRALLVLQQLMEELQHPAGNYIKIKIVIHSIINID